MGVFTKETGKMMFDKVQDLKNTLIITATQASFRKEKLMGWVFINGLTARHTMGNGLMDIKKGMAFGKAFMETHMSANG